MVKSIRNILKKNSFPEIKGSLWIECNGERFFGPGPVELLERISDSGSISQAAKQMNMSYRKAWEIINRMNANATVPLVATAQGGKGGGGSFISDEARGLIMTYRRMRQRFDDFLKQETINFSRA